MKSEHELTSLDQWRERLANAEEGSVLHAHQANWELMKKLDDHGFQKIATNKPEDIGRSPLEAYFNYIYFGLVPPPEVLMSIAESFEIYMEERGNLELEKAFFGPRKSGTGNYAARHQELTKKDQHEYALFLNQNDLSNYSAPERAEKFLLQKAGVSSLGDLNPEDADNLLTEVRNLVRYNQKFRKLKSKFFPSPKDE